MLTLALFAATVSLSLGPQLASRAEDPQLVEGIRLVREGDFESAVLTLDAVARRLAPVAAERAQAALAYVYLGVAYLELEQELTARGKFREALLRQRELRLDPREFSPQVIRIFELTRENNEAEKPAAQKPKRPAPAPPRPSPPEPEPAAPPPAPAPSAPPAKKDGGLRVSPLVLGAGAAASVLVAVALAGSDACTYTLSPVSQTIDRFGGSGVCRIATSRPECNWTLEASVPWIELGEPTSGSGGGALSFTVLRNRGGPPRSGRVQLVSDPNLRCDVQQEGLVGDGARAPSGPTWTSALTLPGGRLRLTLDGTPLADAALGLRHGALPAAAEPPPPRVVAAHVLEAEGDPGTWRFELAGTGFVAGSLRPLSGEVRLLLPEAVVFQLSGAVGESVSFSFEQRQAP